MSDRDAEDEIRLAPVAISFYLEGSHVSKL
jgi:hypothetical protein